MKLGELKIETLMLIFPSISIDVDTEKEADTMMYNFRRRPEVIFQGTMALVSGDVNYIFEK